MAVANEDGSIILTTSIDPKGITEGTVNIKKAVDKLSSGLNKSGLNIAAAFDKGSTQSARLSASLEKTTIEIEKQSSKVEELKTKLSGLKSGDVKIESKDVSNLQKEFDKTSESINKTQAEINKLYEDLERLQSGAFRAPDTGEVVLTGKEQEQFDKINSKLDELEPRLESSKQKAAQLGAELKTAVGAATQKEIEKTTQELSSANAKLNELNSKAQATGEKLTASMQGSKPMIDGMSGAVEKLSGKLLGMAKRVFVFSMLTKALRNARTALGNILSKSEEFQQSLANLRLAIWTAFSPVMDFVIPALKQLVDWLTRATIKVGQFIAKLFGKDYSEMVKHGKKYQSESLEQKKTGKTQEEKNIEAQIKALEKENKGYEKQKKLKQKMLKEQEKANKRELASFDEINVLSFEKDESEIDALDEKIDKNDDIIDQLQEQLDLLREQREAQNEKISNPSTPEGDVGKRDYIGELAAIAEAIVGIALVGLGVILLLSGHPLLGISMIVLGWGTLEDVLENSDLSKETKEKLIKIGTIVGVALIGLGIMLLFTPFKAVGLGMVAAGAASLYMALKLGDFSEDLKSKVTNILLIAGTVMFILGVILIFVPGAETFGFALMAGGVAEIITAIAMNFETVKKWLSDNLWVLIGDVAKVIFIIGVILLFIPGMMYFGLGAIVTGLAIMAVTASKTSWEDVKTYIKDNFANILKLTGEYVFYIGVVLLFIPGMMEFGFGFMVAGIAIVGIGEIAENFDSIKTTIQDFFNQNKDMIAKLMAGLLVIGILLLFTPIWPMGIALIVAGIGILAYQAMSLDDLGIKGAVKSLLNGLIGLFEDFLNYICGGLRELINGAFDAIEALGELMGFSWNLGEIPKIKLPRLAKGAVLPANNPFLAVVGDQKSGTNIEAPLETIVEAMKIALQSEEYSQTSGGTVILNMDGMKLAEALIPKLKAQTTIYGTSILI